jgi:hypothetical protein
MPQEIPEPVSEPAPDKEKGKLRSLGKRLGGVFGRGAKKMDDEPGELHNGARVVKRRQVPSSVFPFSEEAPVVMYAGTAQYAEHANGNGEEEGVVEEDRMRRTVRYAPVQHVSIGAKAPLAELC